MRKQFFCLLVFVSILVNANPDKASQITNLTPPSFATYIWRSLLDIFWYANPAKQVTPTPVASDKNITGASEMAEQLAQALKTTNDKEAFLFGASTSDHQCSKECTPELCSYSDYCQKRNLPQPTDDEYPMNLWAYYKEYFDYAADELNLNAIRFSIEWALVQHTEDMWNQETLDHYADMFVYALKKDITPLVCFHHYTDPIWFLYEKGGFEKEENIKYFKAFCTKVYDTFLDRLSQDAAALRALERMGPRQPLFATFNSPEGYAFKGYREMMSPPSNPEKKGLNWAVTVLRNTMRAHVEAYDGLKEIYKNKKDLLPAVIKEPQIGFLKNIHQLDPAQKTWTQWCLSPFSRFICIVADLLQNESIFQFFTNGVFKTHIPYTIDEHYSDERAKNSLDWIGLNYYSNRFMCLTDTIEEDNYNLTTDNNRYRVYPHGLYRAIAELSERVAKPLNIPLYVTENGIATMDDDKRYAFYQEYLIELIKAKQDGHAVSGYFPWTLADNYEWPTQSNKRVYGLCAVNKNDPKELQYKKGSRSYFDLVEEFKVLKNYPDDTIE